MKPSQVVSKLRQIATAIENSKKPDVSLVAKDLQTVLASLRVGAKLVMIKHEQHPEQEYAVGVYAYFEGKPTMKEVLNVQKSLPGYSTDPTLNDTPQEMPDKISDKAGLSRWYIDSAK